MAEYASNCPISRPINTGWDADWDLGGLMWSYLHGMFYQPGDEMLPIRMPPMWMRTGRPGAPDV